MHIYVEGVGVCGPGLKNWREGRKILAGNQPYVPLPVILPRCEVLPENERRRAVPTVKLALGVGSEALANAERDAAVTAAVFTSSGGDGITMHQILDVLASEERELSPTRFHNSVHNAPSGYWSIATRSREPSTSLCGYDASFAVGLLEAATQTVVDDRAVMLVAYDLPNSEPLHSVRRLSSTFGAAFVFTPRSTNGSLARLRIDLRHDDRVPTIMQDQALEELHVGNPAARSLPLLAPLARAVAETIVLDHLRGKRVVISISPEATCDAPR